MRVKQRPPWAEVKCHCGADLEIEVSDLRVVDGGHSPSAYVVCPVCKRSVYVRNPPMDLIKPEQWED